MIRRHSLYHYRYLMQWVAWYERHGGVHTKNGQHYSHWRWVGIWWVGWKGTWCYSVGGDTVVQGRATTTKMKRGAVAKRRTARFELKMVSHYYTLRMYVTTVFWNNGQTQKVTLNKDCLFKCNNHHRSTLHTKLI